MRGAARAVKRPDGRRSGNLLGGSYVYLNETKSLYLLPLYLAGAGRPPHHLPLAPPDGFFSPASKQSGFRLSDYTRDNMFPSFTLFFLFPSGGGQGAPSLN